MKDQGKKSSNIKMTTEHRLTCLILQPGYHCWQQKVVLCVTASFHLKSHIRNDPFLGKRKENHTALVHWNQSQTGAGMRANCNRNVCWKGIEITIKSSLWRISNWIKHPKLKPGWGSNSFSFPFRKKNILAYDSVCQKSEHNSGPWNLDAIHSEECRFFQTTFKISCISWSFYFRTTL